jgi:hypothetical protein
MKNWNFLYLIMLLGVLNSYKAQVLKFDRFTTKDGLLSDEVYNLHQDKDGYIWLFTNYGVMKYNGKSFNQGLKNLPFNQSFIYSFYENRKGQKWCANSNANIYEIRNDSAFIVKETQKISEKLKESVSEIFQLYVDEKQNIYACTKAHSYKFIQKRGYESQIVDQQINIDSISHIAIEMENTILSISNNGYRAVPKFYSARPIMKINFIREHKKDTVLKFKSCINGAPKHFKRFNETIYFSFDTKLVKINSLNQIKEISFKLQILNFAKDNHHNLWVSCLNDGLYELNENDSIINHYFGNQTINDVICDSQNGIWVSSAGSGLYHCNNLSEFHFDENSDLGKSINILKKIDNVMFVLNNVGDIYAISSDNKINLIKHNKIDKSNPLDILKYKNGFLVYYRYFTEFITINNIVKSKLLPHIEYSFFPTNAISLKNDSVVCFSRNSFVFLKNGLKDINDGIQNRIKKLNIKYIIAYFVIMIF